MTGYVRRVLAGGAVAVLAAGVLAACGNQSASGGGSGSDSPTLNITSPSEGSTVGSSFTVKWDSNVELGDPSTGKDHVHVFVDGNSYDYTVVGLLGSGVSAQGSMNGIIEPGRTVVDEGAGL